MHPITSLNRYRNAWHHKLKVPILHFMATAKYEKTGESMILKGQQHVTVGDFLICQWLVHDTLVCEFLYCFFKEILR